MLVGTSVTALWLFIVINLRLGSETGPGCKCERRPCESSPGNMAVSLQLQHNAGMSLMLIAFHSTVILHLFPSFATIDQHQRQPQHLSVTREKDCIIECMLLKRSATFRVLVWSLAHLITFVTRHSSMRLNSFNTRNI